MISGLLGNGVLLLRISLAPAEQGAISAPRRAATSQTGKRKRDIPTHNPTYDGRYRSHAHSEPPMAARNRSCGASPGARWKKMSRAAGVRRKNRGAVRASWSALIRTGCVSANRATTQLATRKRATRVVPGGATLLGTGAPLGARPVRT